jgi:pimeloyl-ACP methyl ester carboxylesterase
LYNEKNGKPAPGYDSNLGNALSVLGGPMPTLWPQFEALKRVPLMVVRGENSDILTADTVDEMRRRHPAMVTVMVANQGHAPLLKDPATNEAIRHFLTAADAGRQLALATA